MNHRLKTFRLSVLVFGGIVLLTGCHRADKKTKAPPSVLTAVVEQGDVPIYMDAIGQAISFVEVPVRPQVQGKLLEAFVEQGAIVKKGDILYTIDSRPYQATLDQAKAQLMHDLALLEIAEKTVDRYKTVVEDDYISVLTYEQYESNLKAALAQVDADIAAIAAAQLNVDFCQVIAPVSGKISVFNIYPGNIVIAYDPNFITVIRPFDPIDLLFSLPQQQFELVRQEQGNAGAWPFLAYLPEKPDRVFSGVSYFIDNELDQNTGTILIKGRLANENLAVWPGEFVKVKVLHKIALGALTVPLGAVLTGRDGFYVYVVDSEGKVAPQPVKVLTRTDGVAILEPLKIQKGDIVVIDGQINIAPGMEVKATLKTSESKQKA